MIPVLADLQDGLEARNEVVLLALEDLKLEGLPHENEDAGEEMGLPALLLPQVEAEGAVLEDVVDEELLEGGGVVELGDELVLVLLQFVGELMKGGRLGGEVRERRKMRRGRRRTRRGRRRMRRKKMKDLGLAGLGAFRVSLEAAEELVLGL